MNSDAEPKANNLVSERAAFVRQLADLRPRLHRYCARMTGSVFDGEDAVQDALTRAVQAFTGFESLSNPEAWIFRVAHNAAVDLMRRRARQPELESIEEEASMADPRSSADERVAALARLQDFMRLPVSQRSSVILMDVLGYSLSEIETITNASPQSIKASLRRGRLKLRAFATESEGNVTGELPVTERALLEAYAARFNAQDFDAVRDLLAEEVRLEVVARVHLQGKRDVAGTYFTNYSRSQDWHFAPGMVEGRPVLLVLDRSDLQAVPLYVILLEWSNGLVISVKDFRHARYVLDGAALRRLG